MRKPLKDLWDAVVDKNNDEQMLDLISLFSLIIKNEIKQDELQELMEYAQC